MDIKEFFIKMEIESRLKEIEFQTKAKYFEEYNKTFGELEKAYKDYSNKENFSKLKDKEKIKDFIKFILLKERMKYFDMKITAESVLNQNEGLLKMNKDLVEENQKLRAGKKF